MPILDKEKVREYNRSRNEKRKTQWDTFSPEIKQLHTKERELNMLYGKVSPWERQKVKDTYEKVVDRLILLVFPHGVQRFREEEAKRRGVVEGNTVRALPSGEDDGDNGDEPQEGE